MNNYAYPNNTVGLEQSDCSQITPKSIQEATSVSKVKDESDLLVTLNSLLALDGSKYLEELIYNADIKIPASSIRHIFNVPNYDVIDEDVPVAVPYKTFSYFIETDHELPIEIVDEKAIEQYKDEILRFIYLIADAKSNNDVARAASLTDEKDRIVEILKKSVNKFGRPRYLQNRKNKDYQTVHKAIKLIVEKIRALDPALGRLCDEHLENKTVLCWRSDPMGM